MTATEPPAEEPQGAGFQSEQSAEITTEEGTVISHGEQTGVEFPPPAEDPAEEPAESLADDETPGAAPPAS